MEETKKTKGKRSDNKVALTLLSLLFNWLLSKKIPKTTVIVIPCPWINNLSVTRQFQKNISQIITITLVLLLLYFTLRSVKRTNPIIFE